jgi:CPA1 family monovalent cation:H+ antiporter
MTILEGESLINDASALVAYRYAIASVVTGGFVLWEASLQFVWLSVGGALVGLFVAWGLLLGQKRIHNNPTIEVALTLLTPYVAYLGAEHFHFSGVLSVVAAGLYLSFKSPEIFTYRTRMQANSFWETIEFLLNGFVFILIGMQLPSIVANIERGTLVAALGYGVLITTVAIVVRIIWVFPGAYIPTMFASKEKRALSRLDWQYVAIISWTGMRGVVSLASALAIPLTLANGTAFPQRDMILFITFCVIFLTLVVHGLSLRLVIKLLKIKPDHKKERQDENDLRKFLGRQALQFIEENIVNDDLDTGVLERLKNKYEINLRLASERNIQGRKLMYSANAILYQYAQAQKDVLDFQRSLLLQLHKDAAAGSELLKKLEFELDLEELRLNELLKRVR